MNKKHDSGFPSRDAIVAFIRANPGNIGTREIARAFGLKNADRVELKQILRELADDGTVAKKTVKKAVEKTAAAGTEPDEDADAPNPAKKAGLKKAAVKKAAAKPKADAVSKARAPVATAAKTSAAKPAAPKTPAKKSAGKARG